MHAYCGTTLNAAQSDLLDWHRRPSMEDMQKAYVGRSRTRRAHHMLLVQAYSPHLFRQGRLPGPTELMKVLRRTSSTAEAKKAWEKIEKVKKSGDEGTWLKKMTLPCRNCSTDEEESTWLPMTTFTTSYNTADELWKHIVSQGQDLQCLRCVRKRWLIQQSQTKGGLDVEAFFRSDPLIRCHRCKVLLHHSKFDEQM